LFVVITLDYETITGGFETQMNSILMLLSAIPIVLGMFQQGDLIQYPVEVENADVFAMADGSMILEVSGTETLSCEQEMIITQTYVAGVLTMEIYEEATAAITCINEVVVYNESIALEIPMGEMLETVTVNGVVATINDTRIISPDDVFSLPQSAFGELSYAVIDSVSIASVGDDLELTITGVQMGGCLTEQVVEQDSSLAGWLRVSIYCDPPIEALLSCLLEMNMFEITIPVDPAFNTDPTTSTFVPGNLVVEINDYIAYLNVAPTETGTFTPTLQPTERQNMFVETVMPVLIDSDTGENGVVDVQIAAQAVDGCEIPFNTRQLSRTDPFVLQVYRPAPLDVRACPLVMIVHDFTYPLTLPETLEDGQYALRVNNLDTLLEVGEPMQTNDPNRPTPIATVIETVEVNIMESSPPQLSLDIVGYHPDGCDFPVMEQSEIVGDQIYVNIFREVPADTVCTQSIVPYTTTISLGSISPGTYALFVNDFSTELQID